MSHSSPERVSCVPTCLLVTPRLIRNHTSVCAESFIVRMEMPLGIDVARQAQPCVWQGFLEEKGFLPAERGCPCPTRLLLVLRCAGGTASCTRSPPATHRPSWCPGFGDAQHRVDSDRRNEGHLARAERREVVPVRAEQRRVGTVGLGEERLPQQQEARVGT